MTPRDRGLAIGAIRASGLAKHYGETRAVIDLTLDVVPGSFFGLLGPNGSGKTTTIHMLSSLVRPSSGQAEVAGFDVRRYGPQVRARIGVIFQEGALDRMLTVQENLDLAGALQDIPASVVRSRSDELLRLFGMADRKAWPVAHLSGGMQRAVDIIRSIIHYPQVLFLDEPTIGLDLPNRRMIWRYLHTLRQRLGTTLFLTTHYLEEAVDCDRIAFMQKGRIIEMGPPTRLIERLGTYIIDIEGENLPALGEILRPVLGNYFIDGNVICFLFDQEDLSPVLAIKDQAPIYRLSWRPPNLNDVFMWLTSAQREGGVP